MRRARGLYHPAVTQAIAERGKPPKSCVALVCTAPAAGGPHDLCACCLVAAARAAPQRAAVFGDLQPGPDRVLPGFRADFPRPVAGAVGACADRGPHEAGGPPARPAAGISVLKPSLTLWDCGCSRKAYA